MISRNSAKCLIFNCNTRCGNFWQEPELESKQSAILRGGWPTWLETSLRDADATFHFQWLAARRENFPAGMTLEGIPSLPLFLDAGALRLMRCGILILKAQAAVLSGYPPTNQTQRLLTFSSSNAAGERNQRRGDCRDRPG